MRRWILLSLIFTLSAIVPPASTSAAPQAAIATITRDTIVGRAWLLAMGQWTSPVTVYANQGASPPHWGTFYAGRTYTGMAYTQNNPQEDWPSFKSNMDRGLGEPGVNQGTDCSGFASWAWQIPRQTTSTLLGSGYVYQLGSLSSLLPGDGLLKLGVHVGIFYDRLESGTIVMLEQTDPKARRSEWSYSYAASYRPVRRYSIGTPQAASPTPAPTQPPSPGPTSGIPKSRFYGEYFSNSTLSGNPVKTEYVAYPLTKNWGTASPGTGLPSSGYSARWTGDFYFNAGTYTLNVASAGGARVWLDGKLIEDHWTAHSAYTYRDEYALTTGFHTVRVEYADKSADAMVSVRWWKTRTCPAEQFLGEFFSNTYLGGAPGLRTCEAPINYNWGGQGPSATMPDDNFSARWEGNFTFQARPYTFIARADDGVRVWVDGVLIIDQWHDQAATEYRVTRTMTAGKHNVLVRYYDHAADAVMQFRWE